jgi:hypothetical protein
MFKVAKHDSGVLKGADDICGWMDLKHQVTTGDGRRLAFFNGSEPPTLVTKGLKGGSFVSRNLGGLLRWVQGRSLAAVGFTV